MSSKGTRRREESKNLSQDQIPTAATTSRTPSTSAIKSETSRRASLAPAPSPSARERSDDATSPQPLEKPKGRTPRVHVTDVACTPCQNRKSKCNGGRPTCSSCLARGRTDCFYDTAGDQRRTSALKETNQRLKQENQNLKDVIKEICAANDTASAIEIARRLPAEGFQNVEEVVDLLKRRPRAIESNVGEKTLAGTRVGRNSAERSMDIDAAPQEVSINSVLETADTTYGAQVPFPPPASSSRAVNSNGGRPAHFSHTNAPVRCIETFQVTAS
ncbi:hypothetical protein IWX49DRAFT_48455 [Phyllosticta citricarpa]|uniref:Zn(2)-C6 fungal-type domain-containing protein n=2 Tax=Phyllosticta TaxID=121621 RepID=A0ABR1MKC0_9PEZI